MNPTAPIQGFTLTELLLGLAIVTILMSVGAPSLKNATREARLVATTNNLTSALRLARSESVKQRQSVSVCARSTNQECGTDWTKGWLVFSDNGATVGTIDAGEAVLSISSATPETISFANSARTATSSGAITARPYIRFSQRGSNNWRGGGTFVLCDDRDIKGMRAINVYMNGAVRQARKSGDNYKDVFTETITCPS